MVAAREEVRREGQRPANDELDWPGISMVVGAHETTPQTSPRIRRTKPLIVHTRLSGSIRASAST
jgi:hypothetical protein